MLDVMTGALGAVMLILIVLLTQKIGEESMSCQDIKEELNTTASKLEQTTDELKKTKDAIQQNKIQVPEAVEKVTFFAKVIDSTTEKLNWTLEKILDIQKKFFESSPEEDLLTFKIPKKIIMLIDLSGSMSAAGNKYNEDRLSQVKAALKMFIAGMDQDYYVDIVFFPAFNENINRKIYPDFKLKPELDKKCKQYEMRDEAYDNAALSCYKYGYFEGKLRRIESENDKYNFYKNIECLQAYHDTPTKSALEYIFSSGAYNDAEGIILFSDGQPDSLKRKSSTKDELLKYIKNLNKSGKKIFTVGIGAEFRNQEDTLAVDFLKQLAVQNNGFYIGF
jgi:hypothetical protein